MTHFARPSRSENTPPAIVVEQEDAPDNFTTPYTLLPGQEFHGRLASIGGDRFDYISVTLTAGTAYSIAMNRREPGGLRDPYLRLLDSDGRVVALNDDGGPGLNALIRYTVSQAGEYFISAQSYQLSGTGAYSVTLRVLGQDLIGTEGDDSLTGTANDDTINGLNGNDTIEGLDGNDSLLGRTGDDLLYGGAGNDRLFGDDGNDSLYGGAGADDLYGGTGDDEVYGDDGNDRLFGEDGNDLLDGGAGSDSLSGGRGNDTIRGGTGDDTLRGDAGEDLLYGEDGDDVIWSGGDASVAYGGEGADTINGRFGDTLHGDAGDDRLQTTGSSSIVGTHSEMFGGDGNDVLIFRPSTGNTAFLSGGAGDDMLHGGAGTTLDGGEGRDTAVFNHGSTAAYASLNNPAANRGSAEGMTFVSIENLTGGSLADSLIGDDAANLLRGMGGR